MKLVTHVMKAHKPVKVLFSKRAKYNNCNMMAIIATLDWAQQQGVGLPSRTEARGCQRLLTAVRLTITQDEISQRRLASRHACSMPCCWHGPWGGGGGGVLYKRERGANWTLIEQNLHLHQRSVLRRYGFDMGGLCRARCRRSPG